MNTAPNPDQVLQTAVAWLDEGRQIAIATVIETWGSAPRPVGSQLVIDAGGAFEGSVSGGCIEGAVIQEAIEAIRDGKRRFLTFGVSNDMAWEVGLACGGTIRIMVEAVGETGGETLSPALLRAIAAAPAEGRSAVLLTNISRPGHTLIYPLEEGNAEKPLLEAAREAVTADKARILTTDEGDEVFINVFNPPLRMIVVGAVHIAQDLVPMARIAGYDVTVVDPRRSFATKARFPDTKLETGWPDEVLQALRLDHRCAVVTLSHDPKIDDPALIAATASPAFYIGALGSTRTHARRLERLREGGMSEAAITRIHSPVGLDIGARSPAEIAVSILAETVANLRKG